MTYINKQGGTRSLPLCDLTGRRWLYCLHKCLHLMAQHIPGIENSAADRASRFFQKLPSWQLTPATFQLIQNHFGAKDVDLFADSLTLRIVAARPESPRHRPLQNPVYKVPEPPHPLTMRIHLPLPPETVPRPSLAGHGGGPTLDVSRLVSSDDDDGASSHTPPRPTRVHSHSHSRMSLSLGIEAWKSAVW